MKLYEIQDKTNNDTVIIIEIGKYAKVNKLSQVSNTKVFYQRTRDLIQYIESNIDKIRNILSKYSLEEIERILQRQLKVRKKDGFRPVFPYFVYPLYVVLNKLNKIDLITLLSNHVVNYIEKLLKEKPSFSYSAIENVALQEIYVYLRTGKFGEKSLNPIHLNTIQSHVISNLFRLSLFNDKNRLLNLILDIFKAALSAKRPITRLNLQDLFFVTIRKFGDRSVPQEIVDKIKFTELYYFTRDLLEDNYDEIEDIIRKSKIDFNNLEQLENEIKNALVEVLTLKNLEKFVRKQYKDKNLSDYVVKLLATSLRKKVLEKNSTPSGFVSSHVVTEIIRRINPILPPVLHDKKTIIKNIILKIYNLLDQATNIDYNNKKELYKLVQRIIQQEDFAYTDTMKKSVFKQNKEQSVRMIRDIVEKNFMDEIIDRVEKMVKYFSD